MRAGKDTRSTVSSLPEATAPAALQGLRVYRDPIGTFRELGRRHGDIFTMKLPYFGQVVAVTSPDLVKSIFTGDPSRFHTGEVAAALLEPSLGANSLLILDGARHMRDRKLLLPPFHGDRIAQYGDLAGEITREEMESWPVNEPFSLRSHTLLISIALILKAIFGVHDKKRLRRAEELIERAAKRAHLISIFPPLRHDFGRFSPWARFLSTRREFDAFIYEEIDDRRVGPDGDHSDVLSLLLQARDDAGEPMSDEELRDELVTILGAGHETTANGTAWAVERLVRTPHAMEKLRDSVASGEDDYLVATIKETLRMRPPVPALVRKLNVDIELGGHEIPAGTILLPAIGALHYREDLFPEPDDFRPERFLGDELPSYAWIPFGGGIRRCVGAAFAEFEMRTILREIIERADLAAVDPEPERPRFQGSLLNPNKGARVLMRRPLSKPARLAV